MGRRDDMRKKAGSDGSGVVLTCVTERQEITHALNSSPSPSSVPAMLLLLLRLPATFMSCLHCLGLGVGAGHDPHPSPHHHLDPSPPPPYPHVAFSPMPATFPAGSVGWLGQMWVVACCGWLFFPLCIVVFGTATFPYPHPSMLLQLCPCVVHVCVCRSPSFSGMSVWPCLFVPFAHHALHALLVQWEHTLLVCSVPLPHPAFPSSPDPPSIPNPKRESEWYSYLTFH